MPTTAGRARTAGCKRRRLLTAGEGGRARARLGSSAAPPLRRAAEARRARGGAAGRVLHETATQAPPPPVLSCPAPPRLSTHVLCAAAAPTPAPHHVTRSPVCGFETRPPRSPQLRPPRSPQLRTRERGSAPRRASQRRENAAVLWALRLM